MDQLIQLCDSLSPVGVAAWVSLLTLGWWRNTVRINRLDERTAAIDETLRSLHTAQSQLGKNIDKIYQLVYDMNGKVSKFEGTLGRTNGGAGK